MFKGGTNPYDDIVAKTTDENLTGENWELIINLCDKVTDEGEAGARNAIAALLKRLQHRNPNVQLYSLSLADSLSKNCGLVINKEIASRSFTQGLERIIADRTTHDKVKKKALALVKQWTGEFEHDPSLNIVEELYQSLIAKNFKFDRVEDTPPPTDDDAIRRREEEDLQRALEMSVHDKGGRSAWVSGYSASGGAASSSSAAVGSSAAPPSSSTVEPAKKKKPQTTEQPAPAAHVSSSATNGVGGATPSAAVAPSIASSAVQVPSAAQPGQPVVSRVRALHTFEPTELGELAFEKGDIIKVVDRGYKDWWRGQLKGKTGIFPVNYVEPIPEPTPQELQREAEMEAQVFAQSASIDRLLTTLRGLDPQKDNLADNDELQELYRQSVILRPKIVKLIEKYNQKKKELSLMNEAFVKASQMFSVMMEESIAKHNPGAAVHDWTNVNIPNRPDSRNRASAYPGGGEYQAFPWNPAVYNNSQPGPQLPPAQPPYAGYPQQGPIYGNPQVQNPQYGQPAGPPVDYVQPYGPPPTVDPNSPYAQQHPQAGQQPQYAQHPPYQSPDLAQQHAQAQYAGAPQGVYPQQPQQQQPQQQQQQQPQQNPLPQYQQQQAAAPQYPTQDPGAAPQYHIPAQAQPQPQPQPQAQPQPAGVQPAHVQPQAQQSLPQEVHQAVQASSQPLDGSQQQPQQQPQSQPQQVQQQQQQQQSAAPNPQVAQEPPYVWEPNGVYPDPGAQAWAQYYAQGGTDPAGRVYFTPESLPPLPNSPQGAPQMDGSGAGQQGAVQGGTAPDQGQYQQQLAATTHGFTRVSLADPGPQLT